MRLVWLYTDILLWMVFLFLGIFVAMRYRNPRFKMVLKALLKKPLAVVSGLILLVYLFIGLLDSIHYQLKGNSHQQTLSMLDFVLSPWHQAYEKTYSLPLSNRSFVKESIEIDGETRRDYPTLKYGGQHLNLGQSTWLDIGIRMGSNTAWMSLLYLTIWGMGLLLYSRQKRIGYKHAIRRLVRSEYAILPGLITLWCLLVTIATLYELSQLYHIFGTDKIGQDVFFQTIKSVRTAWVIGILTTILMLPFAVGLGTMAGLLGGKIDDVIQYIYTTLSSIPGVLLIAASILAIQVFIASHEAMFPTVIERADLRLLALCVILGITSWTGLCRLVRAETLKIRELDFVQAAKNLGSSKFKIIKRHIIPNVAHILIISIVLDFSMLVLAEAVLSYVGVGVSPITHSWGNMINSARLELAREPVVWWPITFAFCFMFLLVLSVNLFADALRDALDPRQS